MIRTARAIGAATLLFGAAVVLTGCSALGATAGSGSSATDPVLDPSVPSATPTETVASEAPVPTVTPTQVADGRTAVSPLITTPDTVAAGQPLDVSALITSVIEDGGTCSVTVASGTTEKTATAPGVGASSYTACQSVAIPGLAAGRWQVTVQYSSPTSVGTAVKTVEVE